MLTLDALPSSKPSANGDETGEPLQHVPTLTTKADVYNYLEQLAPLMESFEEDDLYKRSIWADPDVEHTREEDLLLKAKNLDGCELGLGCPGWNEASDTPSAIEASQSLLEAVVMGDSISKEQGAALFRKEAFQHRVTARLMEDRIADRCGDPYCMTKSQVQVEARLWRDWGKFKTHVISFMKTLEPALAIAKESDFVEVQRMDLQLQAFRQRFRAATGFSPAMPWPPSPADEGALQTITTIAKIVTGTALAVGGIYLASKWMSRPDAPTKIVAALPEKTPEKHEKHESNDEHEFDDDLEPAHA